MDSNIANDKFLSLLNVHPGPDLISYLPEGILFTILSRLPIREVVRTSLLSTKWIDLWKSITKVYIDDLAFHNKVTINKEDMAKFVNFVTEVLLHLNNSTIEDFSLKLSSQQYDPYVTTSWISCALKKQVKKLHIQFADHASISLCSPSN